MDTAMAGNRKGRPNYTIEFKRTVALEASTPGVSVSKVALKHDLNTNMVFKWRRELRAGLLDVAGAGDLALFPVEVVASREQMPSESPRKEKITPAARLVEIIIGDAIVRFDGAVDAALLRTIFTSLRP
jgi:transposase